MGLPRYDTDNALERHAKFMGLETRYVVMAIGALLLGLILGTAMMISGLGFSPSSIALGLFSPALSVAAYLFIMRQGRPPHWDIDTLGGLVTGPNISKKSAQPKNPLLESGGGGEEV